jgi:hypothetical protein
MSNQHTEILDHLSYIASRGRKIILVTNFRGVPINLCAQIVRTSSATGEVQIFLHHRQIVSLQITTQTLLQSELFPRPVIANVTALDLYNYMIRLGGLAYVSGSMGERKSVRVQPEAPIHVEMKTENGYSISGEIIDISLDGLSIRFNLSRLPSPDVLAPGSCVQMTLGLAVTQGTEILDIQMPAKVAYLNPGENESCCRLGLLTEPAQADQPMLRRYIFDRQTEILEEINQMNNAWLEDMPALAV